RCGLSCEAPAGMTMPTAAAIAPAAASMMLKLFIGRSLADSFEIAHPVRFPGLAAVRRVGLFPMRARRRDLRPDVADADRTSVEGVVGVERAGALEAAFERRIETADRIAAVEPPDRPLPRLRVERAHADAAVCAIWNAEPVLAHVACSAERRACALPAVELDPLGASGEPRLQATVMHLPVAEQEIEIVHAAQTFGDSRARDESGKCTDKKVPARERDHGGARSE